MISHSTLAAPETEEQITEAGSDDQLVLESFSSAKKTSVQVMVLFRDGNTKLITSVVLEPHVLGYINAANEPDVLPLPPVPAGTCPNGRGTNLHADKCVTVGCEKVLVLLVAELDGSSTPELKSFPIDIRAPKLPEEELQKACTLYSAP